MEKAFMSRFTFCLRNLWYYRTMRPIAEELLEAGHTVSICIIGNDPNGGAQEEHASTLAGITTLMRHYQDRFHFETVDRSTDSWTMLGVLIGQLIDFFHFRLPIFDGKISIRARVKGPLPLRQFLTRPFFHHCGVARYARDLFAWLEEALPGDRLYRAHLAATRPDAVLFSPLIDLGMSQFAQLRAAREVGLPTAVVINSWDNLSSKAWLRDPPDRIVVWNHIQRDEARTYHGVAPERVAVTGAPVYDHVFAFQPTESRDAFMKRLGFDPSAKLVVYVASATFDYKRTPEPTFVAEWAVKLRAHPDSRLANAAVVVRPHPKRRELWRGCLVVLPSDVIVWPPVAVNPVDMDSRTDYLTTLWHADAIVGLNTSAFLEGAILRKPVHAITPAAFRHSQAETHHFQYLLDGGLLRCAPTIETHLDDLAETLADPRQTPTEFAFLESFVRAVGGARSASEVVVEVIGELATKKARPARLGFTRLAVRWLALAPMTLLLVVIVRINPKLDPFKRSASISKKKISKNEKRIFKAD